MEKIIINAIIYIMLTSFLLYLLIKEKKIGLKIKKYRIFLSDYIIKKCKIKSEKKQLKVKKIVDVVETFTSAILLVLLIQHFYLGNFLVPTGSMIPTIKPKDRLFGNMVIYKFKKPKRGDIIVFKEPINDKVLYTKRLIGLPGEKVKIGLNGKIFINGNEVYNEKIKDIYTREGYMEGKEWLIPKKGDILELNGDFNVLTQNGVQQLNIAQIQDLILNGDKNIKDLLSQGSGNYKLNGKELTGPILDIQKDKELLSYLLKGGKIEIKEDYYFALGDNSKASYDSRFWGFISEKRIKGSPFVRFWPLNRIGLLK